METIPSVFMIINNFHKFIEEMNVVLRCNHKKDDRGQRKLMVDLFRVETIFKKTLLSTKYGTEMYDRFVDFIINDQGNILNSRVYFRGKQEDFVGKGFDAFHYKNPKLLHKFRINYLFAKWVLDRWNVNNGSDSSERECTKKQHNKLIEVFNEIKTIRTILCENNLPLAINRAKLFISGNSNTHLDYMDLIQMASENLLIAIDKFKPPYKTVFMSTVIGRMTAAMIEGNSETMIKLSPKERRILYRARNASKKENLTDQKEILSYINQSFKVDQKTFNEISSSTEMSSLDATTDENKTTLANSVPSSTITPEDKILKDEKDSLLYDSMSSLNIKERKIIKLKHGPISRFS